jgi:endonuclease/exonuclease/phosphatase family metal-dependent hydrolase
MPPSIRLVTYNVHSWRGTDGVVDANRIALVLRELAPDVVALQEVEPGTQQAQLATLTSALEMEAHFTKTRLQGEGEYGIATLVRHPFEVRAEGSLPSLRGEPRAAQWLTITLDGLPFELVNTHLSVNFIERVHQLRGLVRNDADPRPAGFFPRLPDSNRLIFAGDFNAGYWSPEYRYLSARLSNAQRSVRRLIKPTYPARFPFLRLDHIWVGSEWGVQSANVIDTELTRTASDHLPLLAELQLKSGAAANSNVQSFTASSNS